MTIKNAKKVLMDAGSGFVSDRVMKLSGSLAFYMVFSMGPLLFIIITVAGIFLGAEAVEGRMYSELQNFVGHDTAVQLQQIIKHAAISGKSALATVIGAIVLLVGATSVLGDMQDSINIIWSVRPKPKKGWLKLLQDRFLSFSIIISLSFLLLISLGFSAVIESFSAHFRSQYSGASIVLLYVVNLLLTLIITSFIFAVIFKVLPDAKIKWRDVIVGAILTTLLFLLGKLGISYYISKSSIGTTYGQAGSLAVVLLWIYYSAMILYFGAELTKAYALSTGSQIMPSDNAVTVEQVEKETGGRPVTPKAKTRAVP